MWKKNHKAIIRLRNAFATTGVLQEHVDATNEQLDIYTKAFDSLVLENDRIDVSMAQMRDAVHKIEPMIEKIHADATEETSLSTDQITAMSASMSRVAIISGSLTILVGMALSFSSAVPSPAPSIQQ